MKKNAKDRVLNVLKFFLSHPGESLSAIQLHGRMQAAGKEMPYSTICGALEKLEYKGWLDREGNNFKLKPSICEQCYFYYKAVHRKLLGLRLEG